MVMWMGLAMTVPTRLWLAGVVSQTRDRHLADRLLSQVRTCALAVRALLVATRQMPTLPKQHQTSVSREDQGNSRERKACLQVWQDLCIVTVIKRTEKQ